MAINAMEAPVKRSENDSYVGAGWLRGVRVGQKNCFRRAVEV